MSEWLPQIIVIVIFGIASGIGLAKYGEKHTSTYGWGDILTPWVVMAPLLWWGGFFG